MTDQTQEFYLRSAHEILASVEDSVEDQQEPKMSGDFHEYLMMRNIRDLLLAQTYILMGIANKEQT